MSTDITVFTWEFLQTLNGYLTKMHNHIKKQRTMKRFRKLADCNYGVSKEGVVINLKTERELKVTVEVNGFNRVTLPGRKIRKEAVHRLVMEAWSKNWDPKLQVNHLDGNRSNNSFSNLEMCNGSRNIRHAYETGLMKPKAYITKKVALDIYNLSKQGWSLKKVSEKYPEVSVRHIERIRLKQRRANIHFDALYDELTPKGRKMVAGLGYGW